MDPAPAGRPGEPPGAIELSKDSFSEKQVARKACWLILGPASRWPAGVCAKLSTSLPVIASDPRERGNPF